MYGIISNARDSYQMKIPVCKLRYRYCSPLDGTLFLLFNFIHPEGSEAVLYMTSFLMPGSFFQIFFFACSKIK